jgi:hypothetical protein
MNTIGPPITTACNLTQRRLLRYAGLLLQLNLQVKFLRADCFVKAHSKLRTWYSLLSQAC